MKLTKKRKAFLNRLEQVGQTSALFVCMGEVERCIETVNHLVSLEAPAEVLKRARAQREKWKKRLLDAMYLETET